MNMSSMPMPRALRMRSLYPLLEEDASCSLIYDLERAVVLDVPPDLQLHIASALDTGDLDDGLVDWMIAEDLLTADGGLAYEDAEAPLIMTNWWSLGLVFRRGSEIHSRIDNADLPSALKAVEFIFKQSLGAARVILRLSWGNGFPATETLEGILVEANRRAKQARQELRCELSLDPWVVTPAVAAFVADYSFLHVRLFCGSFPSLPAVGSGADSAPAQAWRRAELGVRRLSGLGDRLTVQCVLAGEARLQDLWAWAKALGVRHLDLVRLEDDDLFSQNLRHYREDLLAIGEEVLADLGEPQPTLDCQPLSRVVNKLMRSESFPGGPGLSIVPHPRLGEIDEASGEMDEPGMLAGGGPTREPRQPEETAEAAELGLPCAGCWARYLCSHSSVPSSPVNASADRRAPTEESCAFWRAEVEVGLRLYHRLAHADPFQTLRLFEEPELSLDPFDRPFPLEQPKIPF